MHQLWIDGGWPPSAAGAPARRIADPATLELVDEVAEGGGGDVRRACAAAAGAQRHWRRMPAIERGKLLHETAGLMRADRAELSTLLTREVGKPRIENLDEVEWCAACFQYYAEIARNSHDASIPPTAEHQINFTVKEPLGVVGAIVPFNYPLLLLVWKIAPALAAGNAVVIKPSELTPLATLRLVERSMAHLPKGIVNVVTGGPAVGAAIVDDPNVACIAFTGSTAVGTRIAVRAAEQLKRVNLELGGIDPLIVFGDADLDVAVPGAAWARFLNNGQVCTSAKRIYLGESIARDFIDRFVAYTATLRIGNGMDPETDIGPMISEKARARVEDQVAPAIQDRARLPAGGTRVDAGPGWFYAPTVLTDVAPTNSVVREEVFGPIASIRVVKDADAAIEAAAQSEYGLGANIYTQNLTWALRTVQEIKPGTSCINDPLTDNDAAPLGGMRKSGMGRQVGEEGSDALPETKP